MGHIKLNKSDLIVYLLPAVKVIVENSSNAWHESSQAELDRSGRSGPINFVFPEKENIHSFGDIL